MKRKKKDKPVKKGKRNFIISILFHSQFFILIHTFYFYFLSENEVNERVNPTIGNETKTIYDGSMISIHMEKITSVRVSLKKAFNDYDWN